MRTVRIEQFEGPLDLLLKLIEEEKMDITTVSLAAVTDQYLFALRHSDHLTMEELADFLVIATRLLYIKSKALLPTADDDEEGLDLEAHLRMYKSFVDASKVINELIRKKKFTFVRDQPAKITEPIFHPPEGMTNGDLREHMLAIIARVEPIVSIPESVIERTISLQDKIARIQQRLLTERSTTLTTLMEESTTKMEIIVTFLALLELTKQRHIRLVQNALFTDVTIESINEPS